MKLLLLEFMVNHGRALYEEEQNAVVKCDWFRMLSGFLSYEYNYHKHLSDYCL